jgi:hypothetical protein
MTLPVMPEKTHAQKMHENVLALKAQGAPLERIKEEIDYWGGKMAAISAEERKLTPLQKVGAAAQTFSDASTLGLGGLMTDAITARSGDQFRANRQARKFAKGQFADENPGAALASELTGAFATPLVAAGGLLKAGQGAGRLARAGIAVGDAAIQSGISGAANSLEGGSAEDLANAATTGVRTGLLGGGIAAGLGGMAGAVTRTGQRIARTNRLDTQAVELAKDIKKISKTGYDAVLSQPAQARLTRPMLDVLTEPDVLPIVKDLQQKVQWRGAKPSDPKFLDAVYKELSDESIRLEQSIAAKTGEKAANAPRSQKRHVDLLKGKFLAAMDNQVPGYRDVVETHATMKGEEAAFERASDIADRVGRATHTKGGKLKKETAAAYLEEVPKLTQRQAELAYGGLLGRRAEAVQLTSSPLGAFGLIASTVRVPLQAHRTRKVLEALEGKAGISYADKEVARTLRGVVARDLGAKQGRKRGLLDN